MTPSQRILFGVVGSILLAIGLVRAAESFDPVVFGNRLAAADEDLDLGDTATLGFS